MEVLEHRAAPCEPRPSGKNHTRSPTRLDSKTG
jgi:hypothetical protein